ncbi:unnamed protein product, partial [Heterosigma akashiwo]
GPGLPALHEVQLLRCPQRGAPPVPAQGAGGGLPDLLGAAVRQHARVQGPALRAPPAPGLLPGLRGPGRGAALLVPLPRLPQEHGRHDRVFLPAGTVVVAAQPMPPELRGRRVRVL